MVRDILREAPFGQIVNRLSHGKLFPYEDQRPGYVVPERYLEKKQALSTASTLAGTEQRRTSSELGDKHQAASSDSGGDPEKQVGGNETEAAPQPSSNAPEKSPYLVEFGENDPDNPKSWSPFKRHFVTSQITLLTMASYIGSAIYVPSELGIMAEFGVGETTAIWGLTLFVCGYGCSPMVVGVFGEVPSLGRTPLYMVSLSLFIIFQIPIIFGKNIATILVCRFLTGFFAGPPLATGGNTIADMYEWTALPISMSVWSLGAVAGPVLGPILSGYAVQSDGWRWSIYILLIMGGLAFIVLFFFLPETFEPTILGRRAARLRRLTGNPLIHSQGELDQGKGGSILSHAWGTAVTGFKVSADPALLFANIYLALAYAFFYLWFEAFPIVFSDYHHFSLGASSLPFLGFLVTAVFAEAGYIVYQKKHVLPRIFAGTFTPEDRLEVGLFAGCLIPISLFIFGWTSSRHIHWIGPIIGASLYLPGLFLLFQSIILYVFQAYPRYGAAVLAANDLFRAGFAGFWPLFGRRFFEALGVGPGSSFLAGLGLIMIVILYLLYRYGSKLRSRSKYALHDGEQAW